MTKPPDTNAPAPAFIPILRVVIWPLTFLLLTISMMLIFHGSIAPSKVSASAKSIEVSFYLLKASQDSSGKDHPKPDLTKIQQTAQAASTLALEGTHILWVDDNPSNNDYERRALETLGIQFSLALSTHDAVDKLTGGKFDLVISDFYRAGDPKAGYTLLSRLKAL